MTRRRRRYTACFILLMLVFNVLSVPLAWADSHAEVDQAEMVYTPFDLDEFTKRAETLQAISSEAVNANAVLTGFGGLERLYRESVTSADLAAIAYRRDVGDAYWVQAQQTEQANQQQAKAVLVQTAQAILQSPCAETVRKAWGEERCQWILAQQLPAAEEQALLAREQALLVAYDQAYQTAFHLRYNGQWIAETNPWLAELPADELEVYQEQAFAQGNAVLGPIYLELVQVRTELARLHGYANYTDYAYTERYGRAYTAADAQIIHEQTAAYIVPLLEIMLTSWQEGVGQFMPEPDLSTDGILSLLAEQLPELSPELTEAYSYMVRHALYDIGQEEERFAISYTTFLPQYGAPFMQLKQTGGWYDWFNLVHEFGHYNSFYQNADDYADWLQPVDYDLAEIHSQGLEMLLAARYEKIWGKQEGRSAAMYHVITALDTVIQACLEDEFEQAVYAQPAMGLEEMNKLYGQLKAKYQVQSLGDSDGSWAAVPNTFHAPLYYFSYAVSMTAALELWSTASRDEDKAVQMYLSLVKQGEWPEYQKAVSACGLADPFRSDAVKNLAQAVGSSWGYNKGASIRFLDVQGHWAQADIEQAVRQELFAGTEPMIFQPEASLSRASAVVLLSRVRQINLYPYQGQQVFDDVAPDSWYGPAVAWAADQGLIGGVSEGHFAPEKAITREQLAALLTALLREDLPAKRMVFADEDAISPWAAASVQQAASLGLMKGKAGAHFAPQAAVTRAEAAVVLNRLMKLSSTLLRPGI